MNTNPQDSGATIDMKVIQNLRELGGTDEPGLLLELVAIYLQDAPQRILDITESLTTGDIKRLERAAHTLKSSSANLGAMGLSSMCREIEEIARTNTTTGIPEILERSKLCFDDVENALRAIR